MKMPLLSQSFRLNTFKKLLLIFVLAMSLILGFALYVSIANRNYVLKRLTDNLETRCISAATEIDNSINASFKLQTQFVFDYNIRKLSILDSLDYVPNIIPQIEQSFSNVVLLSNSSSLLEDSALCLFSIDRTITPSYKFSHGISQIHQSVIDECLQDSGGNIILQNGELYLVTPINAANFTKKDSIVSKVSKIKTGLLLRGILPDEGVWAGLIKDGHIIASSTSCPVSTEQLNQITKNSVGVTRYGSYWVFKKPAASLNAYVYGLVPSANMNAGSEYVFYLIAVLAVLTILTVTIYTYLIKRFINKPLLRLISALHTLEADHLVQMNHPMEDEMQYVYSAFNQMTIRLKSTIEQVYQSKIAAQRSELKQLQSQINPHFLYNSFFQIYRMSKLGDLDGIEELSQKLGTYYQYITRNKQEFIPLEMEFNHARDYVDIQRIRFGRRIVVEFEPLAAELGAVSSPRFILQPILENAFDHGLADTRENGKIYVSAASEGDMVVITIEDNGSDLNDEQLEDLKSKVTSPSLGETTAVANIALRLSIYGGGLTVDRSAYGGLKVKLLINKREVSSSDISSDSR